jgi:hypothetical protein
MIAAIQGLRARLPGLRGRATAIVGVLAVATALGVAMVSTPAPARPEPARTARTVEVVEAATDRPFLDVDAFTALERRLAEERRARAQQLLDRLYPELAFVTVGVELDPRWERSVEKLQPEWPAVLEEERPEAGAPGSRRRVLEPFSGTRESGLLAPEIREVSVALVLDASIAGDRTRRAAIVAAVQKAVGPAGGRDPEVEVLVDELPGRSRAPAAALPSEPGRATALPALVIDLGGWAALLALAALSLAFAWLRRARRATAPAGVPPERPAEPAGLRRQIEQVIGTEPDTVARVVEGWLAEARP